MVDTKTLWHKSDEQDWHPVTLAAVDATHALEVDSEHWKLEKPEDPVPSKFSRRKDKTETTE